MAGKKLHNARNGKSGVGGAVDGGRHAKHWLLVIGYWLLGTGDVGRWAEAWRAGQARKGIRCETDVARM